MASRNAAVSTKRLAPAAEASLPDARFHDAFVALFESRYVSLHRFLNRLSGETDLAADVAQEAFVRLYRRGAMPEAPDAWLVTVALNLLRNERAKRSRRLRLLTPWRSEHSLADPPPSPEQSLTAEEERRRVRAVLGRLPERDRHLLLLQAEGYRYRDIARVLGLHEGSIGALLARARRSFRQRYGESPDAP